MGNESLRRRRPLDEILLLSGFLLTALSADTAATPTGHFVDCEKNPRGSVSVIFDTERGSAVSLGDGKTASNGALLGWREEIRVRGAGDSLGKGEFAVTAKGFGPVLTFDAVARGEGLLTLDRNITGTDSKVVVSLPSIGAPLTRPLVEVTFYCGAQ